MLRSSPANAAGKQLEPTLTQLRPCIEWQSDMTRKLVADAFQTLAADLLRSIPSHSSKATSTMIEIAAQPRRPKMKGAIFTVGVITVALTSFASPAQAQTASDVRCLLASNLFAKSAKEPKTRLAAEASKFFYIGRIHGRMNVSQLRAQMVAQKKAITTTNAGPIMNSCARQMEAGVKMVQGASQGLTNVK